MPLDIWSLANFVTMFYAFAFLAYSLGKLKFYGRGLFPILLPLLVFALVHSMYHLANYLELDAFAESLELSSVVVLLILALQFLREKI